MNWLSFIDLMFEIYKKKVPDLIKIQRKGLLAVKIAQVYALRVDFLNESTCRHLSQLYRSAISLPPTSAEKIIHDAIDPAVFNRISDISGEPLGSASVGQVHRAVLDDTHDIVIKLIKAAVKEDFLRDIRSLRRFVKFILFVYPILRKVADPLGVLDHIEDYTVKELDLRSEVEGQRILKGIYEEEKDIFDLTPLSFPHLYDDLSNDRILLSDRVCGETFDELLEKGELPYERLLDLFRIHGYYIFKRGVFHGDIHPGNIMLADNKIYFIDTSAISTVPDIFRHGLLNFFDALTQHDYDACVQHIHSMSLKKLSPEKYKRYSDSFMDLYRDFADATVSEVSLTNQMMQTIKSAVHAGMEFSTGIFAIIKSFMYLDGMVLRCKPEAKILQDMRVFMPALKKVMDQ
ncbi:AarF/UbiB family protein [Candidatus Omnitrophota bacterium]